MKDWSWCPLMDINLIQKGADSRPFYLELASSTSFKCCDFYFKVAFFLHANERAYARAKAAVLSKRSWVVLVSNFTLLDFLLLGLGSFNAMNFLCLLGHLTSSFFNSFNCGRITKVNINPSVCVRSRRRPFLSRYSNSICDLIKAYESRAHNSISS